MSLVTQGREPRRQMVLRPQPGSKQVVTAIHSSRVTVETGGISRPAPPVPPAHAEVLESLRTASIDRMTPLDALNLLAKLKQTLG